MISDCVGCHWISKDELFALTLNVIGDGSILLDSLEIYVLVPGVVI